MAIELRIGRQRDAMAQRRCGHSLDVVGYDKRPRRHQRRRLGRPNQRDRSARAAAHGDTGPVSRGAHDAHGVVEHRLIDTLARHQLLKRQDHPLIQHGGDAGQRQLITGLIRRGARDDVDLLLERRIGHVDLQQEAIQLGFRQRIGALGLQRILRRQHDEGPGQRQCLALQRHLILLHDLEQGALGLGRRAIDLIGEQHIGEYRTAHDAQFARRVVEHRMSGDVRWHEVRGELDPGYLKRHGLRQCPHQQRLAEPGDPFDQHVSRHDQRNDDLIDHLILANQRVANLGS